MPALALPGLAALGGAETLLFELTQPRGLSIALGTFALVLVVSHVGLQLAGVRRLQRVERLRALQRPEAVRTRSGLAPEDAEAERVEQLVAEKARLEATLRALPVACLVLDADGRIERVNDEAVRLFGRLESELAGARLEAVCVPVDGADRPLHDGSTVRVPQPGGEERELELHHRVLRDTDGEPSAELWTAIERDPSRRTSAQADRDVELAAMARLAATIANRLREPCRAVLGRVCLLRDELEAAGLSPAGAERIQEATEQAFELVRFLAAFGDGEPARPEAVDVAKLLSVQCTDELRAELARGHADVELRIDARADVGYVRADPGQLRDALRQVVRNAVEAMGDEGGSLRVSATRVQALPAGALGADEPAPHPGPWVCLRVADTGPGMSDATSRRAFEPFFTTRGEGTGRGLGLSGVYGLVTRNGGRVALSSAPGRGTAVDLYLPSVATVIRADTASAGGLGRGRTVCVVEDDEHVRMTVARVLESEGFDVVEAEGVDAALRHCATRAVDLVLTDVRMPARDGVELRDELRRTHPDVRVVFMSGFLEDAEAHAAIGDTPFVQKPFTPSELIAQVSAALRSDAAGGEATTRVLIVDDEEMIRTVVSLLLAGLDYECHVASDGAEALEELARRDYDVVLCDMVMPRKDGIELCREIRRRFPKVGVVAMSGNVAGAASLEAAGVLCASATLGKPFSREELLLAVDSATPR